MFFNVPNVKIPMSFAQEGNLRTATTNLIRVSGESFFPIVRHFFHVSNISNPNKAHKEIRKKSYSQWGKLAHWMVQRLVRYREFFIKSRKHSLV